MTDILILINFTDIENINKLNKFLKNLCLKGDGGGGGLGSLSGFPPARE